MNISNDERKGRNWVLRELESIAEAMDKTVYKADAGALWMALREIKAKDNDKPEISELRGQNLGDELSGQNI